MAGSAPLPRRKCCCGAAAEGSPGLLGLLGAPPPHVAGDQTDVWPRAPHHLALVPGAVHSARKGAGASFRGAASPSPGPPREARGVGVLGGEPCRRREDEAPRPPSRERDSGLGPKAGRGPEGQAGSRTQRGSGPCAQRSSQADRGWGRRPSDPVGTTGRERTGGTSPGRRASSCASA